MKRFARSTIMTTRTQLLGRAAAKEGASSAASSCSSLRKHFFHSHSLSYVPASPHPRSYVSTASTGEPRKAAKKTHSFIPKKAPVSLTETTRKFFKALLKSKESDTNVVGIMLNYHQSSSGEPRMVFGFDFVRADQLDKNDESVSLEVLEDGTPKPPTESWNDGLPKLYVHHNAFMKVLGGKLEVDTKTLTLTLYDREGNIMDPNNT